MLLLAVATNACADRRPAKLDVLERVSATHGQLLAISRECAAGGCDRPTLDQAYVQTKVRKVLETTNDVEVLYRLAIICLTSASPQSAGEERIDLAFDFAWTAAVDKIGSSKDTKKAIQALETISNTLRLDGSGSLLVRENLEALKKRDQ